MPMMIKKLLLDGFNPHRDASGFAIARMIKKHFGESIEIHALQHEANPNVLACPWIDYAHACKEDSLEAILKLHERYPFHAIWLQHAKRIKVITQHQSTMKQAGIRCLVPSMESLEKALTPNQLSNTIPQWPHMTLHADNPYWQEKLQDLIPLCDWPLQTHLNNEHYFSEVMLKQAICDRFAFHDSVIRVGPSIQSDLLSAVALCDHQGSVVDIQMQRPLTRQGKQSFFLVNQPTVKAMCFDIIAQLNWKGCLHLQFYQQEGAWRLFTLQTELPSWFTLGEVSDAIVPQTIRCLFDFERHAPIPQTKPALGQIDLQSTCLPQKHYQNYQRLGSQATQAPNHYESKEPSKILYLSGHENRCDQELSTNQGITTLKLNPNSNDTLIAQLKDAIVETKPKAIVGFDTVSLTCLQSCQPLLSNHGIHTLIPSTWSLEKAQQLFLFPDLDSLQINKRQSVGSLEEALSKADHFGYPIQLGHSSSTEDWPIITNSHAFEHYWQNIAFHFSSQQALQLKPRIQGDRFETVAYYNTKHQLFQSISAKQPESHYHVLINPDSVIKPLTALGRHLHWQGLLTCRWTRHYLTEQWILEALSPRPPYWLTSMPRQDFNWLQPLTSPSLTYQDLPSTLNGTILTWYPQLQVHSIHSLPQQTFVA